MVRIYGHPFARAFYWKALIAVYERSVPFEFLMIDADHRDELRRYRAPRADRAVSSAGGW